MNYKEKSGVTPDAFNFLPTTTVVVDCPAAYAYIPNTSSDGITGLGAPVRWLLLIACHQPPQRHFRVPVSPVRRYIRHPGTPGHQLRTPRAHEYPHLHLLKCHRAHIMHHHHHRTITPTITTDTIRPPSPPEAVHSRCLLRHHVTDHHADRLCSGVQSCMLLTSHLLT